MAVHAKAYGLSLGERCCLVLAQHLKGVTVTACKAFPTLGEVLDVAIIQIRQNIIL